MSQQVIKREQFDKIISLSKLPENVHPDFLYHIYEIAVESINELEKLNQIGELVPINPVILLNYCIGEINYTTSPLSKERIGQIMNDENVIQFLTSFAVDKYISNEHHRYKIAALNSRFNPPISTISTYINFMLQMISRYKMNEPKNTVIIDMLHKGLLMSRCILDLLVDGFETEAFSTWRTLHETESILSVLINNGPDVINAYLKHMEYALAFNGLIDNKEKTDEIFVNIKKEMQDYKLVSKDMKRFIEYGWLNYTKTFLKLKERKYNFTDGVQVVANLSKYRDWYKISSEITHSSPFLIYSNKTYFYYAALINVYDSFFRLEKIFNYAYVKTIKEEEKNQYLHMRETYFSQIIAIYKRENSIAKKVLNDK